MTESSFWIFVIAVGAALVAIANIQYNRSREAEKRQAMAQQARALLEPELERNYTLLSKIQATIEEHWIRPLHIFDTTAWQTVSGSDLLLGLNNGELPQIMRAYYLMNRANALHSQILEMSIGVPSALQNAGETKQLLLNNLALLLQELQPIMKSLLESKTQEPQKQQT
jgi:hypothetical protein